MKILTGTSGASALPYNRIHPLQHFGRHLPPVAGLAPVGDFRAVPQLPQGVLQSFPERRLVVDGNDNSVAAAAEHFGNGADVGCYDRRPTGESLMHDIRPTLVGTGQTEDIGG